MTDISFTSKVVNINSVPLINLPKNISAQLPSRGMVMVKGTINGLEFETPLEPDGVGSHFFKIDHKLIEKLKLRVGDSVKLSIEVVKDWPEPSIPSDLNKELNNNPIAKKTWESITPIARWDWIRWINATKNPETRKIRIVKTFSKFNSGIKRPCCFNRSMCTDPSVANNGVLLG